MKAKEWFIDAAKGASLGTGILPGVSVATVGIIVKIYDKLISSIANLRKEFKKSFLTLLPIALGCIVSAIILLVFWKKVAYVYFPFIIIASLAGFVVGGLPFIAKNLKGEPLKAKDVLQIIRGTLIASFIGVFSYLCAAGIIKIDLAFQPAFDSPFQNWWIFLIVLIVGFIAAVSCLIPGISGSMVLFIFGLYNPIVNLFMNEQNAAGEVVHYSIFHDTSKLGGGLLLIAVLLVGILIGFLLASKGMKAMLANHKRSSYSWIIGFILGSLVSMFLNNDTYRVYTTPATSAPWQFIVGAIMFVIVAIATYLLIKRSNKIESQSVNQKSE